MNQQEQRIAIAEACGWYNIQQNPMNLFQLAGTRLNQAYSDLCNPLLGIPDYLNDLNAMQHAVMSQPQEFQEQFACRLSEMRSARRKMHHQIAASVWAEVFIRLLNAASIK